MAKFVSRGSKQSFLKVFWDQLSSLDPFTKMFMLIAILIVGVTPYFINNFQTYYQHAATCTTGAQMCYGHSYTGQYCTTATQYYNCVNSAWVLNGTCPVTGSGQSYCAYVSSTNISCLASCGATPSPLPPTPTVAKVTPVPPPPGSTKTPSPIPPSGSACAAGVGPSNSSCGGFAGYICTSPSTCCEYTYRCNGNSCISNCHLNVPTSYCAGGTCRYGPIAACNRTTCLIGAHAKYACFGSNNRCCDYTYQCNGTSCYAYCTTWAANSLCNYKCSQ